MSLASLLAELHSKNIELQLGKNHDLHLRAKKGSLDTALKERLAQYKQEIIELLMKNGVHSTKGRQIFSFGETKYPLSSGQVRIYFHELLVPGTATYNVPFVVNLRKPIDTDRLQVALNLLLEKHPSLRTRFVLEKNVPQQIIAPKQDVLLNVVESSADADAISTLIQSEVSKPFNLETGPLVRLTLIHSADKTTTFILMLHHIVTDAWSGGLILRDLNDFYLNVGMQVSAMPINMGDFAVYESALMESKEYKERFDCRVAKLRTFPTEMLPSAQNQAVNEIESAGKTLHFQIATQSAARLNEKARQLNVSVASILFALYSILLKGISRQDRMLVGIAAAQRDLDELQDLVGFLVNSVPVPLILHADNSMSSYIKACHTELLEALDCKMMPLDRLVEKLGVHRKLGTLPLIQAMFTYHDMPMDKKQLLGSAYEIVPVDIQQSKFTITAGFYNNGEQVESAFEFNTHTFSEAQMHEVVKKYQALVDLFTQEQHQVLGDLESEVNLALGENSKVAAAHIGDESQLKSQPAVKRNSNEDMQLSISTIWSELLDIKEIKADESFFEIGGNSLLAIQFISKMRDAGMPLTLKHVYKHQTVSAICENYEVS